MPLNTRISSNSAFHPLGNHKTNNNHEIYLQKKNEQNGGEKKTIVLFVLEVAFCYCLIERLRQFHETILSVLPSDYTIAFLGLITVTRFRLKRIL